jgi:hypothetical protein
MIFTGNHNRRRAAQNGQTNSQRRKSSNFDVSWSEIYEHLSTLTHRVQLQGRSKTRLPRDNSQESPSRSTYLPASSSASSNYYSMAGTSSGSSSYMTIPELDENKHDFYLQKTRARDITKRRGAIKLIQRLTFVYSPREG